MSQTAPLARAIMDSLWPKPQHRLTDLRDFLSLLETRGDLKRIGTQVDARLELTEISRRVLASEGPALLFENIAGHKQPVLCNLFGTRARIGLALGSDDPEAMQRLGELLAALRQPEPPKGIADAWRKLPLLKEVLKMAPRHESSGVCQEVVLEGAIAICNDSERVM